MKHSFFNHRAALQVLNHDSLEQFRCHTAIPDAFRVNDDNGTALAYAEARCLAPLHARWPKQQAFPLQ